MSTTGLRPTKLCKRTGLPSAQLGIVKSAGDDPTDRGSVVILTIIT